MTGSLLKISGHIENYHWGKKGAYSFISKLITNPDKNIPYAELWFGAHARAPSALVNGPAGDLRTCIKENPAAKLGEETSLKYSGELPFLMKILSIESALSLQLHPDKINASMLHEKNPQNYPDTNHKPEIAVAISEVHLLYGFRPIAEIKKVLRKNPEFEIFITKEKFAEIHAAREKNRHRDFIQSLYHSVLHAPQDKYKAAAEALVKRLKSYAKLNRHEQQIVQCVNDYGPQDLGVFTILLMNYLVLQPGQAVSTSPNTLHAFLRGDLLECMANSDNVVRAGMTPKFKDIETLENLVEYNMAAPKITLPQKLKNDLEVFSYPTGFLEFELAVIQGSGSHVFMNKNVSPSILLCLEGSSVLRAADGETTLAPGEACFIPAVVEGFSIDCRGAKLASVVVP
jgi:mannose-6-phosphate isomerase